MQSNAINARVGIPFTLKHRLLTVAVEAENTVC